MGITEFIAARLDEDEAAAQAAASVAGPDWKAETYWPEDESRTRTCIRSASGTFLADFDEAPDYAELAAHIARHDPARVLREVAAKRAILAEHAPSYPAVARQEPPGPATVADPDGITSTFPYCATCDQDSPCATLAHLAAVWSDHPDYRAEWKP